MEDLIVVKVREQDQDPLTVKADLLTANSPVFDKLINEFLQTEIEMDDFDTETVVIFITLLDSEEKRIDVIEAGHFRELHKLSVVFEVEWIKGECQRHLAEKLNFRVTILKYDWKLVIMVWEECKFIAKKWGTKFMVFVELFVDSARSLEGTSINWKKEDGSNEKLELNRRFVQEFIKSIDNFEPLDMDVLLRISATAQMDIILESLVKLLHENQPLNNGLKYLLQNLNLPLCRIVFPLLYDNVLEALEVRFDSFTSVDKKLMFSMIKDAARLARPKEVKSVYDMKSFEWMRDGVFQETKDKFIFVAEHEYVTSMNTIVDYILHVMFTFQDEELPEVDAENLVKRLEEISLRRRLKKAHKWYLNGALGSLEMLRVKKDLNNNCQECGSTGWLPPTPEIELKRCGNKAMHYEQDPNRSQYKEILILIYKSNVLSSMAEHAVILSREEMLRGEILKFYFKHPAVPICTRSGKCGFLLKIGKYTSSITGKETATVQFHRDDTWSSKQSEDRIHYHDVISPDDMSLMYTGFKIAAEVIVEGPNSLSAAHQCCLPTALFEMYCKSLERPWPGNMSHPIPGKENTCKFSLYNLADHLVKKKRI